jgi:hypothetical protein
MKSLKIHLEKSDNQNGNEERKPLKRGNGTGLWGLASFFFFFLPCLSLDQ